MIGLTQIAIAAATMFLGATVFSLTGFGIAMVGTPMIGIMMLATLPGLWLGAVLLKRMNEQIFRYAVIAVIITTSAVVLAREAARFVA